MQRQTSWLTAISLSALALGACDGSKCKCGEGPAASGSGVDGEKSVAEVSEADVRTLCRWMQKQIGDVDISDEQTCTADSVGTSTSSADCEAKVQSCLAKPSAEPSNDPAEQCDTLEKPTFPAGCSEVTVSDYETCLGDLKAKMEEYINGLSCAENAGQQVKLPSVPSCEKLRMHCPPIVPPPIR